MATFLGRLADELIGQHGDHLSELCIVLPGRRAGLYLRKELAERLGKPILAPAFFPIAQFLEELDGQSCSDRISLLFELYLCYSEFKGAAAENFETFLSWGETALADFSEIDNYLVDARQLFVNLRSIRGIEEWSLEQEQLSPEQEAYLRFWDELGELYFRFQDHLEQRGLQYAGKQKRRLAERIPDIVAKLPWKHVIIAGMNALSLSEQKLFFGLANAGRASIYWDADNFYVDDPAMEAGSFLRKYRDEFGPLKGLHADFLQGKRSIQVFGTASQISQAKSAGASLAQTEPGIRTAVVLADESLLLPVLHSLPEHTGPLNVTMGYPLKLTPLMSLVESVFRMQIHASRQHRGKGRFYYKDLLALVRHPYIRRIIDRDRSDQSEELIRAVRAGKLVYPSVKDLARVAGEGLMEHIGFLFAESFEVGHLLQLFRSLTDTLREDAERHKDQLANEYLFRFAGLLKELGDYLDKYPFVQEPETLQKLFRQLISAESVAFYGEPLQGLQVLGMLETRALDFEHVILIGANEDLLPRPKYDPSFIPYDLKLAFGLPTYKEREAIYAYYFYRLLSRASAVEIYYNAEPGDFGSGEKSRFITQLEYHLEQQQAPFRLKETLLQSPMSTNPGRALIVEKTRDVLERVKDQFGYGVSPSALNTYMNCPLDYYFKYIAGLREAETMEETLEVNTLGLAVHDTLEALYRPFIGKTLRAADVSGMRLLVKATLEEAFGKHYSAEEIRYGSNHLSYQVALNFVYRFLDWEEKELKRFDAAGLKLELLALEEEYQTEVDMSPFGFDQVVKLKGKADRVDKLGGRIRIIDYKTGSVEQKDLTYNSMDQLVQSKSKALQLMLYVVMYHRSKELDPSQIDAGILSLRKLRQGFISLKPKGETSIPASHPDIFLEALAMGLTELCDDSIPFEHNPSSRFCEFCR